MSESETCSRTLLKEEVKRLSTSFNTPQFSILHLNIRSIQKNLNKLQQFLCEIDFLPDVIALSEIWVSETSFFKPNLNGYEYVFESSKNKAGGVALFIKDSINYSLRNDLKFNSFMCENLWIELWSSKSKKEIIGVIYRHPSHDFSDFQLAFEKTLFNLNNYKCNYYICGDFNIDLHKHRTQSYIDTIGSLGCNQLITSPTRINKTFHTSSLLDHFYSNKLENCIRAKTLIHDISDHFPILAIISENNTNERLIKSSNKQFRIRNMKNFEESSFLKDLELNLNFTITENSEENFDIFLKSFTEIINKRAPFRTLTRKEVRMKNKPWINKALLSQIKLKNRLYKKYIRKKTATNFGVYKKHCNRLNHEIEKSKKIFYQGQVKNSSRNSKLIWKTIQDIVKYKCKTKPTIKEIRDKHNKLHTQPQNIANTLNEHFINIGINNLVEFPKFLCNLPYQRNWFFLKPFTAAEISKHIKSMDPKKSVNPEDPPIKFIKMASNIISPILAAIFNVCATNGIWPAKLKRACVIPIFKKGKLTVCGNYRPISLISPFSKILEKCLLEQLNCYFEKFSLLHPAQFGFKKNLSTEMAVAKVYQSYVDNIEKGLYMCSVFLDISKAFDSVNHKILTKTAVLRNNRTNITTY